MKNTMQKINWKIVARTIISAGLLAWLVLMIDWKDLRQVLIGTKPQWIAAAMVCIVISMFISVSKWQLVLEAQGIKLRWKELWKAYWAGLFFNNFLPSSIGGDTLRIIWAGKAIHDMAGAATSVVVERILATTGLALTGLLAVAFIAKPNGLTVALFIALIIITLVLLGLMSLGSLPSWTDQKRGRIICFLRAMAGHSLQFKSQQNRLIIVVVLSFVFQVAVVGVNYCIFQALQVSGLSLWDVLYIIPVTSVAAMLPLGINGYGVREGSYVALLALYQIPASTAFTASLLFAFLVSICSLYGGYTWFNHRTEGDFADVEIQSFPDSQGRNEVWE